MNGRKEIDKKINQASNDENESAAANIFCLNLLAMYKVE